MDDRLQQIRQRPDRLLDQADEVPGGGLGHAVVQQLGEQGEGLDRLAKVMARGGQKARLRPVRPLGRQLVRDKPFLGPFLFGDVPSDAQNADDLTALRPQRHLEFLDDCSADGQRERLLRGHQTLTGPQDPLILAADGLRVRGSHDVIVGDAGDGTGRAEPDDFREHPVSAEVPGLPVLPVDGVRQLIEDQPEGITARRQSSFLRRRGAPWLLVSLAWITAPDTCRFPPR